MRFHFRVGLIPAVCLIIVAPASAADAGALYRDSVGALAEGRYAEARQAFETALPIAEKRCAPSATGRRRAVCKPKQRRS